MTETNEALAKVEFDPKLRTYLFLNAIMFPIITVVGIVLLPVWAWAAWRWSGLYFKALSCELTPRRLKVGSGIWFRRERTIPLDKIQDISLIRGPVLDALGLVKLRVETAGSGSAGEGAAASLVGVRDAVAFQERVLAQRDREAERQEPDTATAVQQGGAADVGTAATMAEMLAVLKRIEAKLPDPAA